MTRLQVEMAVLVWVKVGAFQWYLVEGTDNCLTELTQQYRCVVSGHGLSLFDMAMFQPPTCRSCRFRLAEHWREPDERSLCAIDPAAVDEAKRPSPCELGLRVNPEANPRGKVDIARR